VLYSNNSKKLEYNTTPLFYFCTGTQIRKAPKRKASKLATVNIEFEAKDVILPHGIGGHDLVDTQLNNRNIPESSRI
jgi:hypothetical protein